MPLNFKGVNLQRNAGVNYTEICNNAQIMVSNQRYNSDEEIRLKLKCILIELGFNNVQAEVAEYDGRLDQKAHMALEYSGEVAACGILA